MRRLSLGSSVFLGISWLALIGLLSCSLWAQTVGSKTVWQNSSSVTPSQVWIDASAYWTSGSPDLCMIINGILRGTTTPYPSTGAVIDARGLGGSNVGIACTGTPFDNITSPPPSTTILLPAGTIPLNATWTIPNNTRIVGEGRETKIQVRAAVSYMIEMGAGNSSTCPASGSSYVCTSVGVEHIFLDPAGTSVNGIDNKWAQESSYLNDVNFNQFTGTALSVFAADSGPYENLAIGSNSSAESPVCIDLEAQTKGVHDVTCIGTAYTSSNPSLAGIYVNASNNSLKDIHFESYWDGIEVGGSSSGSGVAVSNVSISNVNGSTTLSDNGVVKNVVHICGSNGDDSGYFGTCQNPGTASDVTVLGATISSAPPSTTIQDDVSGTSIVKCQTCNPLTTALYVLGEGLGGGYSRLASNPANPNEPLSYGNVTGKQSSVVSTWGVGVNTISNGSSCYTPGALYSDVQAGSGSSTVYVCAYSSSGFVWSSIL